MNEMTENIIAFKKLVFLGLKWIKDNLNVVLILPAILGGLWQLIELSSISFSFVRFFSVSQVVPDGLLMLMILLLFGTSSAFLYYSYIYLQNKYNTDDDEDIQKEDQKNSVHEAPTNSKNQGIKKDNIILSFILMLLYILTNIGYIIVIDYFLEKLDSFFYLVIFIPVCMVMMYIAMGFYIFSNVNCWHKEILSKAFRAMVWCMPMSISISCFLFAAQFHKMFLLPELLVNAEIVKQEIEKQNPYVNTEIIYTNDKYMFIELDGFMKFNGKPVQKLVRVIKFDDLISSQDKGYTLPEDFEPRHIDKERYKQGLPSIYILKNGKREYITKFSTINDK